MASTYTTNLHIEQQGTGDNSGTWGSVLNSTALGIIDQCLGDVQTVSLSASNVTLSTAQSQHNYFRLTGALLANVTVTWPAIGRTVYVYNATSGAYTISLANAGGGSTVVIPQGNGLLITMDPTNGVIADPIPFGTSKTIAGAATIDLGTNPARNVTVSGSGWTCTSFGSSAATSSPVYLVVFSGAGALTHNASSMILPGGISITVAAGDSLFAVYLGSGNWRVIEYTPAAQALIGYKFIGVQTFTASGTYTPTSGCRLVKVTVIGAGGGGGGGYSNSGSANNAGGGGGEGATAIYVGTAGASSQTVTIGTGGPGGSGSATGTAGGSSSFGSLAVAGGGAGGVGGSTTGIFNAARGGAGGTASAGTIQISGADGQAGVAAGSSGDDMAAGGTGGGRGGRGGVLTESGSQAGTNAPGYGGGGGGGARADSGSSVAGGTGANGLIIVEEYA